MDCRQVCVGGFPDCVSSRELCEYLQKRVGVVWRCRIKMSGTPRDAVPIFSSSQAEEHCLRLQYVSLPPHAFVHFATASCAREACKLGERGKLVIRGYLLRIRMASETMNRGKCAVDSLKLSKVVVELGSLIRLDEFMISWSLREGVTFEIDPVTKKCRFFLSQETLFLLRDTDDRLWMRCNYMIEYRTRDIWSVRKEVEGKMDEGLTLLLQFRVPPWIFYRTAEDDIYHTTSFALPDDDDPWIRTLDFTPDKSIGRCLTYRITVSPRLRAAFVRVVNYLQEQHFLNSITQPKVKLSYEVKSETQRSLFFMMPTVKRLPFDIMFLVNALVNKGIVNATSLSPGFFRLLQPSVTQSVVSVCALKHILSYRNPIFDAENRLRKVIGWLSENEVNMAGNAAKEGRMEVRRFIVTPTKAYCCASVMELSNRVLRGYSRFADRFLRVSFLDESMTPLSSSALNVPLSSIVRDIWPGSPVSRTAIYKRVRNILRNGFHLCGRKYLFLAFSANQLRDTSAWFFAGTEEVRVERIREWMGSFSDHNVAKYASRMGQCLSSTYCTIEVPPSDVEYLPDIKRNGYIFSDGIGKISPALAAEVASSLKLDHDPCAYQIRYRGYKGVVATWPALSGRKLLLRDSMRKFETDHCILEIITWTKFMPCFLNRQIITLLSALKVQDRVFVEFQDVMADDLHYILEDPKKAIQVLSVACSGDMHSTALGMLFAGFHPLCEPHLKDMLLAIRAAQMEEVLTKARIFVSKGRWLMGTLDEIGDLEYGQCFLKVSTLSYESHLPSSFTGAASTRTESVITGKVVVAKNPCLHPGDVRILVAVDVPSLHHMIDCIVMPQKGHRPHPNEASGSDLDGDLYFVSWDTQLVPPSGDSWEPMEYETDRLEDLKCDVTIDDLVDFFARHMVNDNLGVICNAHVVHADLSENGALDDKCIQLAKLAATAVDFPKTGKSVSMPPHLRPDKYPDFMEKTDKMSYESTGVLGILFRRAKGMAEREVGDYQRLQPHYFDHFNGECYDCDLEVEGFEDFLNEAWEIKKSYDIRLNALMGQFDVRGEGEMATGHFTTLPKHNSHRQGEVKERARNAYSALKKNFREIFEMCSNTEESGQDEDRLQRTLEMKASAWYHVTYHPDWLRKAKEGSTSYLNMHLLSFPWIAVEFLGNIKARKLRAYESYHEIICSFANACDTGG